MPGRASLNLTGQRFGRLVAVRIVGKGRAGNIWECDCDCGGTARVGTATLRNGHTRSCGCLLSETAQSRGRANAGKVAEAARKTGIAASVIHTRLRLGWSFREATTTPVRPRKRRDK